MKTSIFICNSFNQLIEHPPIKPNDLENTKIPFFSKEIVELFLKETKARSFPSKACLELESNSITIVGDLHGNLIDLIEIFARNGPPPMQTYLFLGDYVDRGYYSLQVITFLLALRNVFPQNVFLLRGNHETSEVNRVHGFMDEIVCRYNDIKIWEQYNEIFEFLPICCFLNNMYFCVHGGITVDKGSYANLSTLQVPIKEMTPFVEELLWNDPVESNALRRYNPRGAGKLFVAEDSEQFCESFNIKAIIRAHQCVSRGVNIVHNGKVITLFSSSNYTPMGNICSYMVVGKEVGFRSLPLRKRGGYYQMQIVPVSIEDMNKEREHKIVKVSPSLNFTYRNPIKTLSVKPTIFRKSPSIDITPFVNVRIHHI